MEAFLQVNPEYEEKIYWSGRVLGGTNEIHFPNFPGTFSSSLGQVWRALPWTSGRNAAQCFAGTCGRQVSCVVGPKKYKEPTATIRPFLPTFLNHDLCQEGDPYTREMIDVILSNYAAFGFAKHLAVKDQKGQPMQATSSFFPIR